MRVKALVSFAGVLTMRRGETKEIADDAVARDLLRAGYIAVEKVADAKEAEIVEKPTEEKQEEAKDEPKGDEKEADAKDEPVADAKEAKPKAKQAK